LEVRIIQKLFIQQIEIKNSKLEFYKEDRKKELKNRKKIKKESKVNLTQEKKNKTQLISLV
jgi:hypothetical protein